MLVSNQLRADYKAHLIFVIILCIGMLPIWGHGYCGYILILLAPILLKSKYDNLSVFILAFSFIYSLNLIFGERTVSPSELVFMLFFPIIIYQSGKYISYRFQHIQSSILLLCLMALSLGVPAIIANLEDIVHTGQIINPTRLVVFDSDGAFRSATGYGIMVSLMCGCFGCLFVPAQSKDKFIKTILALGSTGALITTVHLINRTGIVIALICVLAAFFLSSFTKKRIYFSISICLCLFGLFLYVHEIPEYGNIIDVYMERDSSADASLSNMGGRDERWLLGVQQIFTQPLGNTNGLWFLNRYNYAHNLIIDGGIKGGLLCFAILIYLFYSFIKLLHSFYKRSYKVSVFEKSTVLCLGIALCSQCMVEPIIEALPQYFWFFIFFLGVLKTFSLRKYID